MAEFCEKLRIESEALRDLRNPAPDRPTRQAARLKFHFGGVHRPGLWVGAAVLAVAAAWLSVRLASPTAPAADESTADPPPTLVATASPRPSPTSIAPSVPPPTTPQPLTREQVKAAVDARRSEILARCPDVPPRLTLALDVGPRVELAEVQHVELDPALPLDACLRSIVAGLDLPPSDATTRHVVTLELEGRARQ